MSPSRLRVNSTLPAPTNAILGIRFLAVGRDRGAGSIVESRLDPDRRRPWYPRSAPLKKIPLIAAALAAVALVTAASAGASPAGRRARRGRLLARPDRFGAEGDPRARRASSTRRIRASSCATSSARTATRWCRSSQAVIGSDNYPDIAYVYGSDVPNVAQSSKVVDITKDIKATSSPGTASTRPAARPPRSTARSSASRP